MSGIRQGINAYIRQNNSYIPLSMQFSKIVQIIKAEKEKYSSESYYSMSRKISEVTMFNLKEVQLALFYTETPMSYEEYCKNNEYIGYDGEKYLIERVYNAQARKILENAIKSLTEREKEIIQLKYGLGSQGRYTVKEIADMYYIDKERIRSIEDKALRKLKYKQEIKMLWQL
nr:sigma-70 family RNA polymerase sigma factor [Ruminococcus sp.]